MPVPPAAPPALHGDGPEGVPGMEPPEPLRVAVPLPACAVGSAWPGAMLAARVCSCAAASWPIRLGEVHRGVAEVLEPSADSAASGASWVQDAVGAAAVAALPARDATLDPTGSWATHSPLPAGPFTGPTVPLPGAVREDA
jgi:hypothetical protein